MPVLCVGETTTVAGFRRRTRGRGVPDGRRTARRDLAPDFTISAAARLAPSLASLRDAGARINAVTTVRNAALFIPLLCCGSPWCNKIARNPSIACTRLLGSTVVVARPRADEERLEIPVECS